MPTDPRRESGAETGALDWETACRLYVAADEQPPARALELATVLRPLGERLGRRRRVAMLAHPALRLPDVIAASFPPGQVGMAGDGSDAYAVVGRFLCWCAGEGWLGDPSQLVLALIEARSAPARVPLEVRREVAEDIPVVALVGEVTAATAPLVRAALDEVLAETPRPSRVLVDLIGVQLAAPAALTTLATSVRAAGGYPDVALVAFGARPSIEAALLASAIGRSVVLAPDRSAGIETVRAGAPRRVARLEQPPGDLAPRRARVFVMSTCAEWGLSEVRDDLALVVSELVTNAVRHGHGSVQLVLVLAGGEVQVTVSDGGAGHPARMGDGDDRPGTHGLDIVDALARSWGSAADPGTTVWCSLPLGVET